MKSVAISVVLNKAALGAVTIDQVKAAIAGAFAYRQVNVSVLAADFQKPEATLSSGPLLLAGRTGDACAAGGDGGGGIAVRPGFYRLAGALPR